MKRNQETDSPHFQTLRPHRQCAHSTKHGHRISLLAVTQAKELLPSTRENLLVTSESSHPACSSFWKLDSREGEQNGVEEMRRFGTEDEFTVGEFDEEGGGDVHHRNR